MEKRIVTGLVAMMFVFGCLFMVTSCAKKQVGVSEGITPTEEVVEEKVVVKEEPVEEKEVVVELSEEEKAKQRQAAEFAKVISEFEAENIYFDFDMAVLKPEAKASLKKKAAFLRDNPSYSVLIGGNCDERGTEEYNLALGERRANAAKEYLMALGISGDRIKTISYGELRPADPASNPVAWALNRRDTFSLFQ
ncbi:MAG: peptidoglycan-associated lipoprotein Pal [Deltaproteobacteria bacterium]|nr:peptidoglycan-associated lipoprotein Pal [Deltaproteobacteria bacterium]